MPASTAGIIIFTVEMLDLALMSSVAQQMMTSPKVQGKGKLITVRRTSAQGLRRVTLAMNGREYEAIEQNPEKPSRWGQLAREGHEVVQFKDNETNRFVAVAVDGKVKEYSSLRRDNSS